MNSPSHTFAQTCACQLRDAGFSLVELMVAMTIGVVLIFGATQVYVDSRNAYEGNETIARLQENARYALSVIEPDIRMSNYWGLVKDPKSVVGRVPQTQAPAAFAGNAATDCGPNFGIDLETNIEATDDAYNFGCAAFNGNPMPLADTLTVRRASSVVYPGAGVPLPAPLPANGPLRICSIRGSAALVTTMAASANCAAAVTPSPTPPSVGLAVGQINDLIVNAYYVDANSDEFPGQPVPSLRRQTLNAPPAAPGFRDEEIVSGIEDMQIQLGIDPTGGLGAVTGVATQYLNPTPALMAQLQAVPPPTPPQIVAVRIWLLVRSDTPEVGFSDDRIYEYADRRRANGLTGDLTSAADATKAYQPSLSGDNSFTGVKRYRRLLVSRTIQVRNASGT